MITFLDFCDNYTIYGFSNIKVIFVPIFNLNSQ